MAVGPSSAGGGALSAWQSSPSALNIGNIRSRPENSSATGTYHWYFQKCVRMDYAHEVLNIPLVFTRVESKICNIHEMNLTLLVFPLKQFDLKIA